MSNTYNCLIRWRQLPLVHPGKPFSFFLTKAIKMILSKQLLILEMSLPAFSFLFFLSFWSDNCHCCLLKPAISQGVVLFPFLHCLLPGFAYDTIKTCVMAILLEEDLKLLLCLSSIYKYVSFASVTKLY